MNSSLIIYENFHCFFMPKSDKSQLHEATYATAAPHFESFLIGPQIKGVTVPHWAKKCVLITYFEGLFVHKSILLELHNLLISELSL